MASTERRQKRLKGDNKLTVRQDVPRSKRDPAFKVAQRLSGGTRRAWEKDNPERFQTAQDLYGTSMPTRQIYWEKGWDKKLPAKTVQDPEHGLHGDASAPVSNVMDRQLPGLEDPQAAAAPPRWEDMPLRQRVNIEAQVLAKTGATTKSMTRAIGSQIDQSFLRADTQGLDAPVGSDFYDPQSSVGTAISESAQQTGLSKNTMLNMMGVTSPKTQFSEKSPSGEMTYPNLMAGVRASEMESSHPDMPVGDIQKPASDAMTDDFIGDQNLGAVGYPANVRKAATLARAERTEGPAAADPKKLFVTKGGDVGGMGPKTGPFVNSFRPSQPDFFVADIHSGGGGMMPHLSKNNPTWWKPGTKAPVEEAMGITGIHSMMDFSMRQAMAERGLPSVSQTQAGQWEEERYQSEAASKAERDAVDALGPEKSVVHPDQFTLFDAGSYD